MQKQLKKMWPVVFTSLVALTGGIEAANGSNDAQMRNLENRVSALERSKSGTGGMINPSGRPAVKDGWGVFVTADALLWQPHENGLEYATKVEGANFSGAESKEKSLDWDWDWGFRVGLGYNMEHDQWDLYLNWTWLHGTADNHVHADSGEVILPRWASPGSVGAATATSAKSHWKLRLNVLDLELGREFYVSKWVTLRPHMGLRTAWIRQKYDVDYRGLTVNGVSRDVDMKNKYWGLGVRGGLNTDWGLGGGVSIYGNAAVSILYGFFSVDKDESLQLTSGADFNKIVDLDDFYHVSRAITDLQLGLRYDYMFCDDRYHFGIQLGWEHHMFFGQNQFILNVDDVATGVTVANQGDLTIQGWTLNVRFDF